MIPNTIGVQGLARFCGTAVPASPASEAVYSDNIAMKGKLMEQDSASPLHNKAIVQASFERWKNGTGGPFELLAPDAEWTIVGSSPLSKTYQSKQEFLDKVILPFNARMAKPLVPTIRGIYADGDMVIIFFDGAATAKDGVPYHNTYTWYFQMKADQVIKATAFFDTREFDEFWSRVPPTT